MAIAYDGHRGSATTKTSGTSLAMTVANANIPAGSLVIVRVTTDNFVTTSGESTEHAVTDSSGGSNTYTLIKERTYSPTGAAADGTTASLWYSVLAAGLTSGSSTITLTLDNAVAAKVIAAEEFTGTSLTFESANSVGQTTDPRDVTLSSLENREHLLVVIAGVEGTGLFVGVDADYTGFATNEINTTTGGAATNVTNMGSYRIATLTSDTHTMDLSAARDGVDIIGSFYEAAAGDLSVNKSDTVDADDVPIVRLLSFINKSDSVAVTESVKATLVHLINKSESIAVTESVTVNMTREVRVSDSVSVAESVVVDVSDPQINRSDSISVAENVKTDIPFLVSESESIAVSENVAVDVSDPQVNRSDSITVSEAVDVDLTIQVRVSDGITVTDTPVIRMGDLQITRSDSITVSESVKMLLISDVKESESITVSESVTVDVSDPQINKFESITVSENVVVRLLSFVQEMESITVSENVVVDVSDPQVNRSENIAVSEAVNVVIFTAGAIVITVSDNVTVSESVIVDVSDPQINRSESITVTDVPTVRLLGIIQVSDNISVAESTNLLLSGLFVNATDSVTVNESVNVVRVGGGLGGPPERKFKGMYRGRFRGQR